MGWLEDRRNRKRLDHAWKVANQLTLPHSRVSQEDTGDVLTMLGYIADTYAGLSNSLPFELYDYVELVAMYNPDFSQAVNNIKNLANPGYKVVVNATNESRAAAYRERLIKKQRDIKPRIGGLDGITNNLLMQGAIYGAMCGEWILDDSLSDVVDFAFVNPKNIRFFWDKEEEDWHPYQKVSLAALASAKGEQEIRGSCIRLNTNTFFYQAIYTFNNNPYGVPPLFAALENIGIQREMVNNLKSITKKMGMLGILEVIIEKLPMEPDETPSQYIERCNKFLTNYQNLIQDMINQGGIVHFDDTKVTNLSIAERAQGADQIFKLNEELVFSGLHSLPSVQGRSYSTTETYAGVAYELLLRSVGDFTDAVKYIMEQGCWLMDKVWGIGVSEIKFDFGENKSLNNLQNAQADAIRLNNDMRLWHNRILGQQQVAQRHGVDVPYENIDAPVEEPTKQQLSADEVADSIYKNAITLKAHDHGDPNKEGKDTRKEYAEKLVQLFKPVREVAEEIVEDTARKLV